MRLLIPDIGCTQKPFPKNNNIFLTLQQYEDEARHIISYTLIPYLASQFLKDDDLVSYVQYELMKADSFYNSEYNLSNRQYRFSCGIYAIKKLLISSKLKKNRLTSEFNDETYCNNKIENTAEIKEEYNKLVNKLSKICNPTEQHIFFDVALQGDKISDVAKTYGYSRMGVYKIIDRVRKRLHAHYSEN